MEITVNNLVNNTTEEVTTKVIVTAKESTIQQLHSIFNEIRNNKWNMYQYLINKTDIEPNIYFPENYDISVSNVYDFIGSLTSYVLINNNEIEFEITSYLEYDECEIKDLFFENIIETKEEKENKILYLESKVKKLKEKIQSYEEIIQHYKNIEL